MAHGPRDGGRPSFGRAFTLVELIVVIVIIGVLAAIAIPRFSRATQDAGPEATAQDLAILQGQIELYAAEHGGVYPGYATDGTNGPHTTACFVAQMTRFTAYDGRASDAPGTEFRYGPYLRKGMPALKVGPHAGDSDVKVVTGSTEPMYSESDEVGWVYSDTTGQIVPNALDNTSGTPQGPGQQQGGQGVPPGREE